MRCWGHRDEQGPRATHPELNISWGKTSNQQLAQCDESYAGPRGAWEHRVASTHTNPGLAGFLEEGTFHLVLRDEEELTRRDERESVVSPVQK